MADANLQRIYNRLNGTANYHPYTANTYADWSLEAGDIVTVSRDGRSYSSPIHSTTVRWNGHQQVAVESRGEKERGSIAKMSARAFNSGGGGGAGFRGGMRRNEKEELLGTRIDKTDEAIVMEAWDRRNADQEMSAKIQVAADDINLEVKNRKKEGEELRGMIDVQAGRVSIVVDENNKVKAGVIVDAINNGTVTISGSKVAISGTTTLNSIMSINSGSVYITKPLRVASSVTTESLQLRGGGSGITLTDTNMATAIKSASVDKNVLTLTPFRGNPITFSKATTQTGAWSGSLTAGKSYKVEAKQNGVVVNTHYSPQLDDYYTGTRHWSGTRYMIQVTAYDEKGTDVMRKDVDVTAVYNDGKGSVTPESHTFAGYFTRFGSVDVEGRTYMAYITNNTSDNWNNKAVYI